MKIFETMYDILHSIIPHPTIHYFRGAGPLVREVIGPQRLTIYPRRRETKCGEVSLLLTFMDTHARNKAGINMCYQLCEKDFRGQT